MNFPQRTILTICSGFLEEIVSALEGGDQIELRGFGKFRSVYRSPFRRVNPRTREPVIIPPKQVVRFTSFVELFTDPPKSPKNEE